MKHSKLAYTIATHAPVVTAPFDATLGEALRLMRQKRIHHLVITHHNSIHGIVSDRDLYEKGIRDDGSLDPDLPVGSLTPPLPAAVTDRSDLREALELMRTHGCSALPLVRDGQLVGILTESDLLRVLQASLGGSELTPTERGQVALSSPLMANLMQLLAEAGI